MNPALQWTRTNIPTLDERRILITGANSGIGYEAARLRAQDAARGALATVIAAASREARGGDYPGPGGRFEMRRLQARTPVDPAGTELRATCTLWDRSEELTGLRFGALRPAAS